MPYDQAATVFAPNISPAVHLSACGDIYTSPMLFPDTLPTTQIGPVGPRGLRLGTPTATIEAMFPAGAALTTPRVTTVIGDSAVDITERMFSIANVGGGPMNIGTVGGNVSTITWGDPAYVYVQGGRLRCPSERNDTMSGDLGPLCGAPTGS